jgi:hypothetical protein
MSYYDHSTLPLVLYVAEVRTKLELERNPVSDCCVASPKVAENFKSLDDGPWVKGLIQHYQEG